ncbi:hypothetical protein NB545_16030 [Vibrio campbellii]|uniref:hypothetical protein n=2 Tax=Vibrio harveyi group TaxID=717610 RepID=UPI00215CCF54|nr:hypothetical protein [Vibrio campbellii]MCR9908961.1 hypothetical protein [Vibrio campbellii]
MSLSSILRMSVLGNQVLSDEQEALEVQAQEQAQALKVQAHTGKTELLESLEQEIHEELTAQVEPDIKTNLVSSQKVEDSPCNYSADADFSTSLVAGNSRRALKEKPIDLSAWERKLDESITNVLKVR